MQKVEWMIMIMMCLFTYVQMLACIYLYIGKSEDKEIVRVAEKKEIKISHRVLEIVLGTLIFPLSLKIYLLSIY